MTEDSDMYHPSVPLKIKQAWIEHFSFIGSYFEHDTMIRSAWFQQQPEQKQELIRTFPFLCEVLWQRDRPHYYVIGWEEDSLTLWTSTSETLCGGIIWFDVPVEECRLIHPSPDLCMLKSHLAHIPRPWLWPRNRALQCE